MLFYLIRRHKKRYGKPGKTSPGPIPVPPDHAEETAPSPPVTPGKMVIPEEATITPVTEPGFQSPSDVVVIRPIPDNWWKALIILAVFTIAVLALLVL